MSGRHYSDEELTLYYYGEGRRRDRVERHLHECASCAALYREITSTLAMIEAPEVPERGEQYGLEVWQRIQRGLEDADAGFDGFGWFAGFSRFVGFDRFGRFLGFSEFGRFAVAGRFAVIGGAAIVLLLAAFVAGKLSGPVLNPANPKNLVNLANPTNLENRANLPNLANPDDRVLIASVAEHLDRSERVLTSIMNASAHSDISTEQRWAEDLVDTGRLYRQRAIDEGQQPIADVLDDLERNLVEIVHSPSTISAAELEQIRRRVDAAALLFKVRVMSDELRRREDAPRPRPTGQTS